VETSRGGQATGGVGWRAESPGSQLRGGGGEDYFLGIGIKINNNNVWSSTKKERQRKKKKKENGKKKKLSLSKKGASRET